ncbi:hypothetical protein GCM10022199_13640 [Marihabitans asiaticum]|uniref:alpha/beta hydrolase family protein n=1 Tax=Marihabitans asiaticum TaxID=415218 RepID=UPI0031D3C76B
MTLREREIDTPEGPARIHLTPRGSAGSLVLTHGAGGGIGAGDLVAITEAMSAKGWTVALVEMPWRVAGKKVASPPPRLDAAWVPLLAALTSGRWALPRPLVVGGRSAGARVACRTCVAVGADAVLALSFPLVPPGKGAEKSRVEELLVPVAAGRPVAVVQGRADPFGSGDDVRASLGQRGATVEVDDVAGNHTPSAPVREVVPAVEAFLATL